MRRFLLMSLCLMVVFSMINAGDFTYVGSKKCKMCHKGEKKGEVFEKWEKGPHSKAFEAIKKKGEEKNPECLKCHSTGFGSSGYKVGDANAANFEGVGCESCHGPGSAYKKMSVMKDKAKSLENGLIEPNENVCKKCHVGNDHTGAFNFAEAVKKIDHTYQK